MGKVEKCYAKVVDFYLNQGDLVTAVIWARKTSEIIIRSVIKKDNPNADLSKRTIAHIRNIENKKLIPPSLIDHMWNINNNGNRSAHGDTVPDEIPLGTMVGVISNLKDLYDWYKYNIEPYTEENIAPYHQVKMNKDLKTFSFVPKNP